MSLNVLTTLSTASLFVIDIIFGVTCKNNVLICNIKITYFLCNKKVRENFTPIALPTKRENQNPKSYKSIYVTPLPLNDVIAVCAGLVNEAIECTVDILLGTPG